uniref:Type I-B CRISPR-associated protein Cas8b1/Cst1 n=1 Tax=Caldilinea aerophila TaxID=133453 RepID=A0A7C1JKT0_9CHLR
MFTYAGHLYFDVGIATITAFVGKRHPSELTEADLEQIAVYMEVEYLRQPLRSFLTVVFPNSGFTQPAFFEQPEKQRAYARNVLRSFHAQMPRTQETCVFTGKPATAVSYDVKGELPPGRAFRQHVPLLTGENPINFFPYGDAGLPVSGEAMIAIQAFPLGCAKAGGRLLAVHSDNEEILLHFAASFLNQNRRLIQLAQESGSTKLQDSHLSRRTLLVDTLLKASRMQKEATEDEQPFSLTAYHLSNSGQGVSLDIYHLPMEIIVFLREMQTDAYRHQWEAIVQRAWERAPTKKRGKQMQNDFQPRINWLYEDIFSLPDNARMFVRTYFLRQALRAANLQQGDPRGDYSLRKEVELVSWKITARFLRSVMNMERERIEEIRKLGDRLAEYVSTENDRKFFQGFLRESRYAYFRSLLLKANLATVRRGNPPLVTLEPYITVFEDGDEVARGDWSFARDLVLIRMIERLHESGWLRRNSDAIPDERVEDMEFDQG